jgi:hypothetical protein
MTSGGLIPSSDRAARALPILLGEVHTELLQHSTALSQAEVKRLLAVTPGDLVTTFERPVEYACSPSVLVGLDCDLVDANGTVNASVVGTSNARASITGGHVLQTSTSLRIQGDSNGQRRPWSHYLSRPGMVHITGHRTDADLIAVEQAFTHRPDGAKSIDLASVSSALVDQVQESQPTVLDLQPPVRVGRTQLRWSARVGRSTSIHFSLEDASLRTLRITVRERDLDIIAAFCEDVALHDWLLTCLLQIIDRTRTSVDDPRLTANRLRPVLDHLVHLWMPSARHTDRVVPYWESLDQTTGFSRQWAVSSGRVRDRFSAAAAALINPSKRGG